MQLNKVNHSFDNLKFIFVLPAKCNNRHCCVALLYGFTIMQLFVLSISLVLFILYAALIIYYAFSWNSISEYNLKPQTSNFKSQTPNLKLSIIIPARNEDQNIKACLDSIFHQNYPKELYEVIVIDDYSTDGTAVIVKNAAAKNVRLISLKELTNGKTLNAYKKKAIEIAVAQSNGEIIITTDADCLVPENWLQTIASFYQQTNASFIAMPVSFLPALKGEELGVRCIEIFQSLDFMTLQGITGASVHKRIHSMCNGANLAYTRKAFEEVNGFKGIDSIASGDDMLLMHKIYQRNPGKVFFLKSKDVIVQTQPMKTGKDFFNQRIRWASKADKYDDKRIFGVLLLVYLFNLLLVLLPVFCLFRNDQLSLPEWIAQAGMFNCQLSLFQFWVILLICKTIVEMIFLYPVAAFFSKQYLLFYFPIAQPFHILYTIIAGWLGKFGTYQWKGRSVK